MEELAKLEAERGTQGYALAGEGTFADGKKKQNKAGKSGGDYCAGKCGDAYQYVDGGGVLQGEG